MATSLFLLALVACTRQDVAIETPDIVFVNGRMITMDAGESIAEAVTVHRDVLVSEWGTSG